MNDLVRKDEVLELLYEVFEKHSMATDKNSPLGGFGAELFKSVKAMSTAYDIDNVVEELEKAKDEIASEDYCRSIYDKENCYGRDCFKCCAEYLIEIVKQGGTGKDVK